MAECEAIAESDMQLLSQDAGVFLLAVSVYGCNRSDAAGTKGGSTMVTS